jgi:hypothetical protein
MVNDGEIVRKTPSMAISWMKKGSPFPELKLVKRE